jgi:hypothetical protein
LATLFEDIYSLALVDIQDYKLDELANIDIDKFYTELQSYLIRSLDEFPECQTSLSYTLNVDPSLDTFDNDLTTLEQSILADIMLFTWLKRNTNILAEMAQKLQGRDMKTFSSSNHLKSKKDYNIDWDERIQKKKNQYLWDGEDLIAEMGRIQ